MWQILGCLQQWSFALGCGVSFHKAGVKGVCSNYSPLSFLQRIVAPILDLYISSNKRIIFDKTNISKVAINISFFIIRYFSVEV
jgi:hypothetical protein